MLWQNVPLGRKFNLTYASIGAYERELTLLLTVCEERTPKSGNVWLKSRLRKFVNPATDDFIGRKA